MRLDGSAARYWGIRTAAVCTLIWCLAPIIGFPNSVALMTVFGLSLTLIGIALPTPGVFGVGILCVIDPFTRVFLLTGGLLRWNTMNYVLLLAILVHLPLILKRHSLVVQSLKVFAILLVLQLFLTPSPRSGMQHILGMASFFGLLIFFTRGCKDPQIWQWLAFTTGVVAAVCGFIFFPIQDTLPYINWSALFTCPLCALYAAAFAFNFRTSKDWVYRAIWILVVINTMWVVFSGSRGGITIAIPCVIYLISQIPGTSRRLMFITLAIGIGAVLAYQFADRQALVMHRVGKTMDSDYDMNSRTNGRSDLIKGGWQMFLQHPLVGVGTGGFAYQWKQLDQRKAALSYASGKQKQAHSGWIKTLAETGIIGFLLLLWFTISFWVEGSRTGVRTAAHLGLLVMVTLIIAFISTEFQGKAFWFCAAGAAVVFARVNDQKRTLQQMARKPYPRHSLTRQLSSTEPSVA